MTSHIDIEVTKQMKHITTVILLCVLAVMTLFIATSCKSTLSTSKAPSQPGLYIDTGFGYKSDKEVPWAGDTYSEVMSLELRAGVSDFQEQVPVEFKGSVIKIATRSMGWTYQQADAAGLFPLTYQQGEWGNDLYVCSQDMIQRVSVNESRSEQSYTYVEIRNVPRSPSGLYCLYVAVEDGGPFLGYMYRRVFLRRPGSSVPAKTGR